jgi:hypothetical protein
MLSGIAVEGQVFRLTENSVYMTGAVYSTHFTDAFSFTANPAELGLAQDCRAALSAECRWMLKDLACYQGAVSLPAGGGGMGLQFHYAGGPDDYESALALAYGRSLGRIDLGLQFRYDATHVAFYGNRASGSVMLGLRFHPAEKVFAGLASSVSFSGAAGRGAYPEKGPGNYSMGFGYEASEQVLISMQFLKEWGVPLNVLPCLDYRFADRFFASAGLETGSCSPYFKAGWRSDALTIEIFTAYHAVLGFTPGLVLMWEGKKRSG